MENEQKQNIEKTVVEEAILLYYNQYLLDRNIISVTAHGKMVSKIAERTAAKRKAIKHIDFFNKI